MEFSNHGSQFSYFCYCCRQKKPHEIWPFRYISEYEMTMLWIVMTHLSQGSLSFLITLLSHWLTLLAFFCYLQSYISKVCTIKTQLNLVLFVFWANWAIRKQPILLAISILFEVKIGQSIQIKNPTIFNIIRWVAGLMGQTSHRLIIILIDWE